MSTSSSAESQFDELGNVIFMGRRETGLIYAVLTFEVTWVWAARGLSPTYT